MFVPMLWREPRKLNGVLFTGGGLSLAFDTQYYQTAQMLYDLTLKANDAGDYMPLWGTWCVSSSLHSCFRHFCGVTFGARSWCSFSMGFQLLNIITSHNQSVLSHDAFNSENLPLALNLTTAGATSRMMSAAPPQVLRWLTSDNITVNLHHDGVKPETFRNNEKLSSFYTMISTNQGRNGNVRVSTSVVPAACCLLLACARVWCD